MKSDDMQATFSVERGSGAEGGRVYEATAEFGQIEL